MRRALSVIVTAVVTLSSASTARSQPSATAVAAEELFREGRTLLEQRLFTEACAKLGASEKLDPAVGTLFSLGECYEAQSRLASAWFAYRAAAALAAGRSDERRALAQKRADAIEPHLAHVSIRFADPTSRAGISLDGDAFGHDALETPLPVDPGTHRVESGASWSTVVEVPSNGVTVEVAISAEPPPAPTPVAQRPTSRSHLQRTLGLAGLGGGAATLAVGTIFGLQAIVKGRDANRACPATDCSNAGAVHENGVAKTYADVSTALVSIGAVLAAAGGVLLLTSRSSVETTVAPGMGRLDVKWSW
jgi:hypothetical protein